MEQHIMIPKDQSADASNSKRSLDQMETNLYATLPLDAASRDIRLLTLQPCVDQDDPLVHCEMKVSLDTKPYYFALSYTWDQTACDVIEVNGQIVTVSATLANALTEIRTLKANKQPIQIWVDALCINQENGQEKNHQVRQMRQIYEQAHQVIVWLRDPSSVCHDVAQFLHILADADLAKLIQVLEEYTITSRLMMNVEVRVQVTSGPYEPTGVHSPREALHKLAKFWDDPWWRRTWIVQELVVSTDALVLFGRGSIPWDVIGKAMASLRLEYDRLYHLYRTRTDIEWQFRPLEKERFELLHLVVGRYPNSLENLRKCYSQVGVIGLLSSLVSTRDRESTDPRDKVFALLGLATDAHEASLEADYSMPLDQVFKMVVPDIIKRERNLDVLLWAPTQFSSDPKDLPSWCPDWVTQSYQIISEVPIHYDATYHHHGDYTPWQSFARYALTHFKVPPGSVPSVEFSEDLEAMFTVGFKLGEIQQLSSCIQRTGTFDGYLEQIIREFVPKTDIMQNTKYPLTEYSCIEALEKTLGLGRVLFSTIGNNPNEVATWERSNFDRLRPFKTDTGLFGMGFGFPEMKVGDMVFLLPGGRTPFILRKKDDNYMLVSGCYVHGVMNGEYMKGAFRRKYVQGMEPVTII